MNSFSVIIVTWNALDHLQTFLPSVTKTDYPDFEIIIADNASTDGTKAWIRDEYPSIKIASLDDNYGYCGGNNRAVPFAENDILIFLNNDVMVDKNWLHALNSAFKDQKKVAIQPKMLSYHEPEKFEYAGAAGGYVDKYGYPFCRGRIFEAIETDQGQYDDEREIFWASGAALAIKKESFIQLGGFDEDFEFHMEEIDLCWRLQNQGYTISYCPESIVYHLGGGSLPMGSPRKVYYNFRNSLYMLLKNYSKKSMFFRFPIRVFLDLIALLKTLAGGNLSEFRAITKAYFNFIKNLKKTLQKRRSLSKLRTVSGEPSTMKNYSIVWRYFIKGKTTFIE